MCAHVRVQGGDGGRTAIRLAASSLREYVSGECETSVSLTVSGSSALALGFRPGMLRLGLPSHDSTSRVLLPRNACRIPASPRLHRQGLQPGATDPVYTTLVRESH